MSRTALGLTYVSFIRNGLRETVIVAVDDDGTIIKAMPGFEEYVGKDLISLMNWARKVGKGVRVSDFEPVIAEDD
jgi:hypothetical protein